VGVKGGRGVGLTPYHLHVPIVSKYGSLNPQDLSRPVMGLLYLPTSSNVASAVFIEVMMQQSKGNLSF